MERRYDVIVVGGGPAGVAAAIASARNGSDTLLIEQNGYLGGTPTAASLPAFCTFTDGIKPIVRGIGLEILEELKAESWRSLFYDRKPDRIEGIDWLPIDAEALKRVLDRLVLASGCDVLLHTVLTGCEEENGRVRRAFTYGPSGVETLAADVWVDATGDANLCAMAGCAFEMGGESGQVQAGTLCFQIANFDTERFLAYAKESGEDGNLTQAARRAQADGAFPEGEVKVAGIALGMPGMATLNFGHAFGCNPLDSASVTRAEMESRARLPELMRFLRRYVPGAENAVLALSGPSLGVRESRRVTGDYVLGGEDHRRRADFEDAIAYYAYPIDFHASRAAGAQEMEARYRASRYAPGESYGIPYRCLTPKNMENLLVAGRCISCDRAMQASLRVVPCCFATGQAAGTAAAMAARDGLSVREVDASTLRAALREQGCYLK